MKLDDTIDERENAHFKSTYSRQITQLSRTTQFEATEVASILMVFHKFCRQNPPRLRNKMQRSQFVDFFMVFFPIYDLPMVQRVAMLLCEHGSQYIEAEAFVQYIALIMSDNLEEKSEFAFKVYDVMGVGSLDGDVISSGVEKYFSVGSDEDELSELKSDMTEYLLSKFDMDRDGCISADEYRRIVKSHPPMMEFMGEIFPGTEYLVRAAYCMNILSYVDKLH
ncbi:calcineurin B-like protein 10 [Drosophila willistoni]|nr:calcineurin B-like protein 10 [Drosophila willistoni]